MRTKLCIIGFLCLVLIPSLVAQYPGTGLYRFGSYDNKGFDSINLGNLNTHFSIPIVSKPGRGLNFTYTLAYDGLVWASTTSAGTGYWQPDGNWGFYGQLGEAIKGYISYDQFTRKCFADPPGWFWAANYTNYQYHDQFGVAHLLNYSYDDCASSYSGDGSTSDDSGIRFDGAYIHLRSGAIVTPAYNSPGSSGTITDTNGNSITNNGNGTFTDTTGTTELTIAGGGNASSPLTFTYPVLVSGVSTTATATVYYQSYTIQTNFGCSGISEYAATSVSLVDHITLADSPSDTYTFTYEPTPGVSGAVTGRLASVTLPSGGTISYTYSGGALCSGGINTDGTPAVLVRATSDGSKTYTRDISGAPASTTTVADEKGNEADLSFISDTSGNTFETSRSVYQGANSGQTPLESKNIVYNSLAPSIQITPPITQTSVTDEYNGQKPVLTVTNYQSGLPTSVTTEDPSNGNAALIASGTSYNGYGEVTSSQTTDPQNGNAIITSATYGYDETAPTATSGLPQHSAGFGSAGNQTSAHISTGSGTLDSSTAYYDTGMPVSVTAPGGFTTANSYDPTQTFTTQTSLPTPASGVQVTTSASYDANSGVQTSATGPNSGQTFNAQYDALFRQTQLTTPEGGQTTSTYTPNQVSVSQKMNATQSSDQETFLDGYGRTKRVAIASGTGWYLTDYCYDATGLLQSQSVPYFSSAMNPGGMACSAGAAKQYTYDALGRKTQISSPDGSSISLAYTGRAVQSTSSNGVSRITQHDLLGRVSRVCELSSGTNLAGSVADKTPTDCGGDLSGSGFLTQYAYDLSAHKTTITQGVQTRIFQTDAAGRTIYTSEPESGVTNYSYAYNGTGLVVTRTRPQANQKGSATTTTTTQYDSIGRPLTISYSDGTPLRYFAYDGNGLPPGYWPIGHMSVEAEFSNGTLIAQRNYTHDVMGRVFATDECLECASSNSVEAWRFYGYDLASNMTAETYTNISGNVSAQISLNYGYNLAGQLVSMSGGQNNGALSPSIYSVQAIGPSGPTLVQYGNGLYGITGHDIENRTNLLKVCNGSTDSSYNETCSGGSLYYWAVLNTVGNQVKSMADSTVGEGSTENYDEFGRLSSQNYSYGWMTTSVNYVYDRYGNRWQQNITQGSGPAPVRNFDTSTNHITSTGYDYDAVGNVISDGFHSYSYDAENNLISIDGGATATFVYDALNERVKVSTSAGSQDYGYDLSGKRSTVWTPGSTTMNAVQYYAGASPVAYWTASDGNIHFEHQDWLGTERMRTSVTGAVDGSYSSLPYGDNLQVSGSDTNPGHFAMLDQDVSAGSGLSHAMFREYSSTTGNWLSPDPYRGSYDETNPQSLNRYAYALNMPLAHRDPSGLNPIQYLPAPTGWDITCTGNYVTPTVEASDTTGYDSGQVAQSTGFEPGICFSSGPSGTNASEAFVSPFNPNPPCKATQSPSLGNKIFTGLEGVENIFEAGDTLLATVGADIAIGTAGLSGTPFSGGGSDVAAGIAIGAATTYGIVSASGKALTGASQLYVAFGGDAESAESLGQAGDILSEPISGVGTLMFGGSAQQAQQQAQLFGAGQSGAKLRSSQNSHEFLDNSADFMLSLLGIAGNCP